MGFKCFEKEINSIRAGYAKRDEFSPIPNDRVSVFIDTYNRLKNAYVFAVNPSGVQYDGIYTPERDVDFSWDTQFESKTAIYDSFWVAEVKIYFSSLKFPSAKEQKWRIHLRRFRPRGESEVFSWAPIDRNNPSFLGQAGIIIIPCPFSKWL
ncbi:MAG: carbohydrate binding family 9 domain-containing protein [Candidatus Hydrothermales bacterium]